MQSNPTYKFTSQRLGFRSWDAADLDSLSELNSDSRVMNYFPSVLSRSDSQDFMNRMNDMLKRERYCYFAVDELDSSNFIGLIGLAKQNFDAAFTPCVDLGWRLHPRFWGKGYATEGALKCMKYGFNALSINKILAMAPQVNKQSIAVMNRIGMKQTSIFIHPKLNRNKRLQSCVLYELTRLQFEENYD
ncbi:MAG: RimJ/RimL family protein N-acetyltransferase [Bacteroidia bacterium]|jgi:RimJ/RimL family protein N-acetyltransferase